MLTLVIGVPWGLSLTGSPVEGLQALRVGDVSDTAIIAVLQCITWVAWAQIALAIVVDLVSVLIRVPMPTRVPGVLGGQQRLARALVGALILAAPLSGPLAAQAAPVSASAPISQTFTPQPLSDLHVTAKGHQAGGSQDSIRQKEPQFSVTITDRGSQTLWDLAEEHLGDGQRWREIWALNRGAVQADGTTMHNPDLLKVGWEIIVPGTGEESGPADERHVDVEAGQTLSSIAAETGTSWQALWEANQGTRQNDGRTFSDPDLIQPGWSLSVPTTPEAPADDQLPGVPSETDKPDTPSKPAAEPSPSATSPAPDRSLTPSTSTTSPSPTGEPSPSAATDAPTSEGPTSAASPSVSGSADQPTSAGAVPSSAASSVTTASPTSTRSGPDSTPRSSGSIEEEDAGDSAWTWLAPGAGLLAGLTVLAVRRQRRRQLRHRRPGRMIRATPPELISTEKALKAGGDPHVPDVQWIDEALRDLSEQLTRQAQPLPDLLAATITDSTLELLIAPSHPSAAEAAPEATSPPAAPQPPLPWQTDPGTHRWRLHRTHLDQHLQDPAEPGPLREPDAGLRARSTAPPFPALVGVGHEEGQYVLVDLEHAAVTHLIGDPEAATGLARFMAAELANNTWSEQLRASISGIGSGVVSINPDRLQHIPDPSTAVTELHRDLREHTDVLDELGLSNSLNGRQDERNGDAWMPQIAMLTPLSPALPGAAPLWPPTVHALIHALKQRRRTGISLVLVGDDAPEHAADLHEHSSDWWLHVDSAGRLSIPALGITAQAHHLSDIEAARIGELLASTDRLDDVPMPDSRGDQPWDLISDVSGGLRPGLHTVTDALGHRIPLQIIPTQAAQDPTSLGLQPFPDLQDLPTAASPDEHATPQSERVSGSHDDAEAAEPFIPDLSGGSSFEESVRGTFLDADAQAAASPAPEGDTAAGGGLVPFLPATSRPESEPSEEPFSPGPPGPGPAAADPEVRTVVLPASPELLAVTATTAGDIQRLSPSVAAPARQRVENADPDLDADLEAWHGSTLRPRLAILGPIQVRASGQPLAKRVAWHTEVLCYLTAHPRGVTGEQMETDLWPHDLGSSTSRLRNALYLLRGWLGRDQDGELFLPHATPAVAGGPGLYRVHGLLSDAELFRRLRLRGVARGAPGLSDLERALTLVTGVPFEHRRPGGYSWLSDIPLDHEFSAMIIDTAHLVATAHISANRPADAIRAAQTALKADHNSDIALLDLVAACDQLGLRAEADSWVTRLLQAHDAEVEEDLPPRTAEILHRRRLGQVS
nr:LysM peptidoglycan-binding domain-containing protein [Kineosporia rhizophila]